jgi:hypothetical protein
MGKCKLNCRTVKESWGKLQIKFQNFVLTPNKLEMINKRKFKVTGLIKLGLIGERERTLKLIK